MNREEGIKIIAYHIWEEEGSSCHGNDVQHWLKAETIWQEQNKPLRAAIETTPIAKTKPAAALNTQQNKKDQFSRRKS
jgi:hypothetical protein